MILLAGMSSWVGCTKELEQQNQTLAKQVDSLEVALQIAHQENSAYREQLAEPLAVGFEVQIGAFESFDVQAYNDELHRFDKVESNGLNKYVLGRFSRLEDAKDFVADVKRMGITDAWIAGVVDGERTTVAQAVAAANDYYGDF